MPPDFWGKFCSRHRSQGGHSSRYAQDCKSVRSHFNFRVQLRAWSAVGQAGQGHVAILELFVKVVLDIVLKAKGIVTDNQQRIRYGWSSGNSRYAWRRLELRG